jgi:hypothetical protein
MKFLGMKYTEANKMIPTIPFCESKIEYQLSTLKEKNIWIPEMALKNMQRQLN